MTFDEFKVDFLSFIENSTVNLGRRTSQTRRVFMEKIAAKFDAIESGAELVKDIEIEQPEVPNPLSGSVMRIKPTDPKKALSVGKGVHAMTPSESARADEQLNRSPFTGKKKVKEGK